MRLTAVQISQIRPGTTRSWAMGWLRWHLPFVVSALADLSGISQEYPDDPALQAAIINKAIGLADGLLSTPDGVKEFSSRYL